MERSAGSETLTAREREIARAYAGGQTYRDIAAGLFIAPSTVRGHVGAVYRKLGVSSKIALLRAIGEPGPQVAVPSGRDACPSVALLAFDDRRVPSTRRVAAEALPEGIMAALSRFRFLRVVSNSVASPAAGAAGYLVVGSLGHAGPRLHVQVALVDRPGGTQVWTRRFETERAPTVEALDELLSRVAAALAAEIEAHEIALARQQGAPPSAWTWVCRGLQDFPSHDRARLQRARQCFEKALSIDPTLAAASAHLARTHFYDVIAAHSPDPADSVRRGLEAARAALALDDREDHAWLSLGYCLTLAGATDDALAALDYGLRLNPANCHLYNARALARLFSPLRDYGRVIDDEERALALSPIDPLRWTVLATIGWALLADECNPQPERALPPLREAGTVTAADWHVHIGLAIAHLATGDLASARASVAEARRRCASLSLAQVSATLAPLLAKSARLSGWASSLPEVGLPIGDLHAGLPKG